MAYVWKLAGIGVGAALIAAAFLAGWAASPDSSPPASRAAGREHSEAMSELGLVSAQSPADDMTRLCTEMMPAELRPAMQQMMEPQAMRQMMDSRAMQQMMQDMMKQMMPGMMGR